jgi:hypothetical protein
MLKTRTVAKRLTGSTTILTVLLAVAPIAAEEPELITDRPDQTESAFTVPRGLFQIEGGWGHAEGGGADSSLRVESFPQALLRIGLNDAFELRIGVPGFSIVRSDPAGGPDTTRGLVDATLGFKVRIAEEKGAVPQTAFLGTLLIPSGDDELSADRADPAFRFLFSNTLSQRLSIGYNIGMAWLTERDALGNLDTRSFFDWTVSLGIATGSKLGVFVEGFGLNPVSGGGEALTALDGGVTYLLNPRLQLDATVTAGLSSLAPDWGVGLGVSYRFPRFKG